VNNEKRAGAGDADPLLKVDSGEQLSVSIDYIAAQYPRPHHPLAKLFPRMTELEFAELRASIESNGLREDIAVLNGDVLDGVNREAACLELGVVPRYLELPADIDPLHYVIDKNLHRRHLTTSQRGLIAAEIEGYRHGGDRRKQDANLHLDRSAAAQQFSVSERTVAAGAGVRDRGVAELKTAVRQGAIAISAAADIAKLPGGKQREVLSEIARNPEGKRALRQVAKQVRAADQQTRHVERQHKLEAIAKRNPELPTGRLYSLVLVDMPRHFDAYSDDTGSEKAPENHFPTIPFNGLCDFPINRFAAPNALCLSWSTAASLIDDVEILAEWGFVGLRPRDEHGKLLRGPDGMPLPPIGGGKYGSHQIWRKCRVGRQTGMGRWFRDQHEILIVARRGDVPAPVPGTQDESVFDAVVGAHSEKPHDHVRTWIDRCWPHLSKIELFARGVEPPGWKFWGNQVDEVPIVDGTPTSTTQSVKIARTVAPAESPRPMGDDGVDIPTFLRRGHPDCVMGK